MKPGSGQETVSTNPRLRKRAATSLANWLACPTYPRHGGSWSMARHTAFVKLQHESQVLLAKVGNALSLDSRSCEQTV